MLPTPNCKNQQTRIIAHKLGPFNLRLILRTYAVISAKKDFNTTTTIIIIIIVTQLAAF
jgi:hypothetical protein